MKWDIEVFKIKALPQSSAFLFNKSRIVLFLSVHDDLCRMA